jgi:hypothetical protein
MNNDFLQQAIDNYHRDWSARTMEFAAATQAIALLSIAQSLATIAEKRPSDAPDPDYEAQLAFWMERVDEEKLRADEYAREREKSDDARRYWESEHDRVMFLLRGVMAELPEKMPTGPAIIAARNEVTSF